MRLAKHLYTLLLASTLPLAAACGGDDSGGDGVVDPTGTDHLFVVSVVDVPSNGAEATALGLDIDDKPNDANGGIDNQLGMVLGNLGAIAPTFDVQATVDEQVDQGGLLLLTNLLAKDLASASGVGLYVYLGDNPRPPACTDMADMVCRKHLTGTGMFDLSASSPTDAKLAGKIIAGKFTGGPGTVTLQLALTAGQPPIDLPLQKAKAELTGISATGFTGGKIGGAISKSDLETKVYPAIGDTIRVSVMRDCPTSPPRPEPTRCNCEPSSTGATLIQTLDMMMPGMPADCMISNAEVISFVGGLITPDIDLDGNGMADAVSLGLGVKAVKASFTVPPR